jgi:hypothetical protein
MHLGAQVVALSELDVLVLWWTRLLRLVFTGKVERATRPNAVGIFC